MNALDSFRNSDLIHAIGWTIIHSFWQGLLVVLLLSISLLLLRKQSSQIRYLTGLFALIALSLCSIGTFVWILKGSTELHWISSSAAGVPVSLGEATTLPVSDAIPVGQTFWQLTISFLESSFPLIVLIWISGVLLLTLRFLAELAYVQRLKHQPGHSAAAIFQERLQVMAKKMGIKKYIQLKETTRINGPMVIGIVKPVILVPLGLLSQLNPVEVESILAHELAHIRRHDYLLNLLQSLVQILLFFNPAIWWISSLIRTEREHCCDDMAISITGNELAFAQTLAKLEERRVAPDSMAMAFNGSWDTGLLARVKRILNSEEPFKLPFKLFWSSIILLCSLGFFALPNPQTSSKPVVPATIQATFPEFSEEVREVTADHLTEKDQVDFKETDAEDIDLQSKEGGSLSTKQNAKVLPKATPPTASLPLNKEQAILSDTVPESLSKLKTEFMQMEKAYRDQELVFQKQSREIQNQKLQIERDLQKMETEQLQQIFELEKKSQELETNRNINQQELEIELNGISTEGLEIDYQLQKAESDLAEAANTNNEEKWKELKKAIQELHRQKLELEKKKRQFEIAQQRKNLDLDKEMQQLMNQRWQLQQQAEIKRGKMRIELLELEQQLQEIQYKRELAQNEKEHQFQLLQLKFQEEQEKLEKEN